MFGRLVEKELLYYLFDLRFVAIFVLCILLSVLSVYAGTRIYRQQLLQYDAVTEDNRSFVRKTLEDGQVYDLKIRGYLWTRRPEALSPVVYGLSGKLGQEVEVQYQFLPIFEDSPFAVDPVNALFGVLDFAFIVKIILSLCVLLLTYDAICGEKESGTLRLYTSFPIPKSTLALAKLIGSTIAVLIPFVFAYLLAWTVLVLSPDMGFQGEDWARMAALMGVFALYLMVFAAFGLWVSALTHRRITAFLGLLGLWTAWIFVLPNAAVRTARSMAPEESIYEQERQSYALRWEAIKGDRTERRDYMKRNPPRSGRGLSGSQREEILNAMRTAFGEITEKWDAEFYSRLKGLQADRRNQMRKQQDMAMVLSSISPLSAVSFASMDLARTGLVQQERIEDALHAYLIYMSRFIREKGRQSKGPVTDFSWFTYRDRETVGGCLSRNAFPILNLALLAILGFAGAYVAILRYDVR